MQKSISFVTLALLALLTACSRSPQSYVEAGNKFAGQGNYAEALMNYRKALQEDPKYGEAVYRIGLAELRSGNVLAAYESLRQASEMLPDREDVQVSFADLALSAFLLDRTRPQAFYDAAQKVSNALLQKNANSAQGLRLRGALALASRRPDEAIADLQKSYELKSDQDETALALAQALFQAGRAAEAESFARAHLAKSKYPLLYDTLYGHYLASKRVEDAVKILEEKIAAFPKQSGPVLELARHYARAGNQAAMASALQRLLGDPAQFPLAPAEVGDFYLSIGRPAEALSQYEAGLKSSAKDKLPYQKRIANLMINTGRGAEAMPILEEILKQNPADEEALSVRASQWLNSGKPEELDRALTEFQALVKKSPSNAIFRFNLGRAYQLKGRNQEARAEFLEALRLRPAEMQPRFALAGLALRTGRTEEAIRFADEILTLIPGQPRARLLRSAGLLNAGNPAEARSELRRLIAEFPQYRDAYLQLAMVAIAEKKFPEAETLLRQSERLPGGADPRFAAILAESFASQNRADDALRTLEEAVRKTPDSPLLRSQLAGAAARAGRYDAAIEQFQWILARNPNALNAQVGLGEVYGLKGDAAKAVEHLRKAREIAPNQVEVHLLLGTQLENARQFDEAKDAYRHALRVQPDNLIALNNLASLIAETGGSLEEALQLAQRAVAKAPKQDPVPTDTLGWIYLKKGMADTARQIFANLVKTHPDNAVFRYHFGATLLQQGDRAGARTELEAALQRQPSADIEKKTRELLAKL